MEVSTDLALMICRSLSEDDTRNLEPYKGVCESLSEFRNSLLITHLLIIFAVMLPPHLCSLKP